MMVVRHFFCIASCAAQEIERGQTPESFFGTPRSGARPRPQVTRSSPCQGRQSHCLRAAASASQNHYPFFPVQNACIGTPLVIEDVSKAAIATHVVRLESRMPGASDMSLFLF